MVKDLVCGMEVDPNVATGKSVHKGQTYYFCSLDCKKKFDKNPEKYIEKQGNPSSEQQHQHHK
jgi:Cu+-exporting ATPase